MKKTILFASVIIFAAIAFMGFMSSDKITVKGSDTMVILSQRWAERYMTSNPATSIQVTGGGSGTGISALINGTTDICNSSRPMKTTEIQKLKERFGTMGVEIPCAKDGITVYLNPANGVSNLTIDQLKKIYTGQITNWKDVGGNDARIIMYSRENNSGTYVFFKDNVLKGQDYSASCQNLPGTAAVVNAVSKDKNGIGYGGHGYSSGVKMCKVNGIEPNAATIASNQYPISRNLFMYLRNRPSGAMKQFIDWILSPDGQKIVTEIGYFPIK
jgi:phosphate transport system substrate-binding protein